jgi:hypothetical protein
VIRALVERIAARLGQPQVIYDVDGVSPYLSRYYLLGRPRVADGSAPFDRFGNPHPEAIWPAGWGLYLHRFHRGDKDRELHNHPWQWSCSLVLAGGYREERRQGSEVVERLVRPGRLNWIGHDDFHRVDLLDGEAWTLFLAGPKVSSWGFWERATGGFTHWRAFLDSKRAGAGAAAP